MVNIFFSYSHKDERYKEKLESHLAILKRNGLINPWNDRQIDPGDEWKKDIDLNLRKAHIILLLVSANFLASDYCYDTEASFALDAHKNQRAEVLPVILAPCLWRSSIFAHLQALPKDGKPITSWTDKEKAWATVAEKINHEAKKIQEAGDLVPNRYYQSIIDSPVKAAYDANGSSYKSSVLRFLKFFFYFTFSIEKIQSWAPRHPIFGQELQHATETELKEALTQLVDTGKVVKSLTPKGVEMFKIKVNDTNIHSFH